MAYNAYEFEKSLERPEITVRRGAFSRWWRSWANRLPGVDLETETVTYHGRILSAREFFRWVDRTEELEGASDEEAMTFLKDFLRDIGIPPSVVLDLPPVAMQEALESFFGCQARAAGADPSEMKKAISQMVGPQLNTSTPNGSRTRETTESGGSRQASRSPTSAGSTDPSSTGGGTSS